MRRNAATKPAAPRGRLFPGIAVGVLGALGIWLATPYVNFVTRVGFIADGQLPVGVIAGICLLVLVANPLLYRFRPTLALSRRQLAVAVGIMLIASVPASGGLLRMLVHSLAMAPTRVSTDKPLADAYETMDLPPSLFPDEMEYQADVPASTHFLDMLPKGETIPWDNWLPPLLTWGTFMIFSYLMMSGLGLATFVQWHRNERLPFPLLTLERALIEEPENDFSFGPLFRKRSFLIAAGVVFFLHLLAGGEVYWPGNIPSIPLSFDISRLFTSTPFVFLPSYISTNRIYFTFIALAFFMPNRVGSSIWFWQIAYALYIMWGKAYFPPFYAGTISHHRSGAMVALAIAVLWLGRQHWLYSLKLLLRRARDAAERRDKLAAIMVVVGCIGMAGWLMWTGVGFGWALALVAMAFMLSLVTARLVAETGLIQVWLYEIQLIDFAKLLPAAWYSPTALFFVGIVGVIFGNGGRVAAPAMVAHAVGLDDDASPRQQAGLLKWTVPLLVFAIVICGAMHLAASYHHATSLDGTWRPLTPWGSGQLEHSNRLIRDLQQGILGGYAHNGWLHFGLGIAMAGVCQWLCLTSPRWPIHPVGLLIVTQWHANLIWFNVLVGWALKLLLVRYGGSRLYRAAVPAMIGLIIGELLAGVFWMVVGLIFLAFGMRFQVVPVIPY